jgi:transposase
LVTILVFEGQRHVLRRSNWAKTDFKMAQIKSWTVSDAFWAKVEPWISVPQRCSDRAYLRKPGGGRRPMQPRQIFSAIVYVLRTGCQWKSLLREFGSASAVHLHFQKWQQASFFLRLWQAGLAEYDEMEAIAWNWQSIDGAMHKAPLATECVGPNPTDRGKKWAQAKPVGRRIWGSAIARRQRRKHT